MQFEVRAIASKLKVCHPEPKAKGLVPQATGIVTSGPSLLRARVHLTLFIVGPFGTIPISGDGCQMTLLKFFAPSGRSE